MDKQFEVVARKTLYQGFFKMESYQLKHALYQGGMSPVLKRELFERGDAVCVLPYDPRQDTVVLVEQFRVGALKDPAGPWLLEIVAGIFEPGESPEQVALRETEEEAGCTIQELIPISTFYLSPGGTSERHFLYCGVVDATGVSGVHGLPEEGEDILVQQIALDQAHDWVASGRIQSASPIIALQWLMLNRDALRKAHG